MDSYRVEKQAVAKIQLPDADAEIEPVPTTGCGRKPEPELDRPSNIIMTDTVFALTYDKPGDRPRPA